MCDRAGLLIGWDEAVNRALVTRANCDSWACDECRKRMSERWGLRAEMGVKALLAAGDRVDFVTMTGHEKLPDFASTERVWRHGWAMLYNALKRRKLGLEYIIVPEKHKDGRMHVHALWNAGVSQKWLKDNARRRGLGYKAKVDQLWTGGGAQKYVVKYVGKSLGDDVPVHFRRVRCSQGWADVPVPANSLALLRWEYVSTNGALQAVYTECKEKHFALIDLSTGGYFDDVDLGTIVFHA